MGKKIMEHESLFLRSVDIQPDSLVHWHRNPLPFELNEVHHKELKLFRNKFKKLKKSDYLMVIMMSHK